jgi:hypothetical protein
MELLYIILGWLLGLLSPLIINQINKSYSKKELFDSIKTEIKDCQIRVILVAELLNFRFGKYDKKHLKWCLSYLQDYQGTEPTEDIIKQINRFIKYNDEDLKNAIALKRQEKKESNLNLKKFHLPFLDSKISEISFFSIELQNIIYEIISKLQMINEEIDLGVRYFYMTFDSSISPENHNIIKNNLIKNYITLKPQLVILVKKMDNCLNYKI